MTDSGGQKLAYVYFEDEPGRRSALPKKVPQVKEEELCCGLRLPAPPIDIPCPPRNPHTLNLRLSATTLTLFFFGRIGSSLCLAAWDEGEDLSPSLPGFDTQRLPSKKTVRMGDKAKPSVSHPGGFAVWAAHFDLDQRRRLQSLWLDY